jgi:hypothetical protein
MVVIASLVVAIAAFTPAADAVTNKTRAIRAVRDELRQ